MLRAFVIYLVCLAGPVVAAADFPPITDAERALDAVQWQPGAPAVVLFEKGELELPRTSPSDSRLKASSYLRVNVRLKILTEEGKRFYGEQRIPHNDFERLSKVDGRTVLADGRIVPLPKDAVFKERVPYPTKQLVTKIIFPAVEVGAILDYKYTLRWELSLHIPTWYFQRKVPTRLSEITYIVHSNQAVKVWGFWMSQHPAQSEFQRTRRGKELRLWSEELPGIHREPHGLPLADLSSHVIVVPTAIRLQGQWLALFESWESICQLYYSFGYRADLRTDRQARKKARELAAREASRLEKIAAVHAFVRDEIETDGDMGIQINEEDNVDAVLAAGRGRPVVKALVLQSMLAGLDVESDLVWVADRTAGRVDFDAVTPSWFDAALVRIEVDREPMYLDPFDRGLGLGHIAPRYEGTRGLMVHHTTPEIVELPSSPFEHNLRRAVVDLEIADDGRVEGGGTLELEGHQAGRYLGRDAETVAEVLRFLLATKFRGYDISDVEVEQDIRRQHVRVGWSLERSEKESLGDEVTVQPSLPLGPLTQLFSLHPSLRKTAVLMDFGLRDDLVLTLRWPPGWEVGVVPEDMAYDSTAGKVECRVEADEVKRSITFRRRFELTGRKFAAGDSYRALRNLYQQASEADVRSLVLVRKNTYSFNGSVRASDEGLETKQ